MAWGPLVPEFVIGLEVEAKLEEGDLVSAVVVVAEVVGIDGKKRLGLLSSEPMTAWQQYGFLRSAVLAVETELREAWEGY